MPIRSAATGAATAARWIANRPATASVPRPCGWSLSGSPLLHTVSAALSSVFVLRCIRETRGRHLEET
ncbi:hypothetical protein [Nocardiopsis coralliicola]